MLIKIGDCWADPEEIVAIEPCDSPNPPETVLHLHGGDSIYCRCPSEEAEAALRAAGYIETPEEDPAPPELTPEELLELKNLQAYGYEWIARDKSGQAYAYWSIPEKSGAEWYVGEDEADRTVRLSNRFDFLDWEDYGPTAIAWLIGGAHGAE